MKQVQLENRNRRPVALEDQTLREAFQIHPRAVAIGSRAMLLKELARAGLKRLQIGSLVRPDRMPQMAGSERLLEAAAGVGQIELWVLVFNQKGLQRAKEAGLKHVALSASLSDIHSRRNLGCSRREALARCRDLAAESLDAGMNTRMGLQCAFGGPLLLPPQPEELAGLLGPFSRLGVGRLALCDTAGRATPLGISLALRRIRRDLPGVELGLHLHGEPRRLAASLEAAWQSGVDWLDVSLGGNGGCPFLPGVPPPNLSTEQALDFMIGKGADPGIDLKALEKASRKLGSILCPESSRRWV